MDIRGRGGRTIQQHWKDGPVSYLGIATAGFPNMFMVLGANRCFANLPPVIEAQVEFISDMISRGQRTGGLGRGTRPRSRSSPHLRSSKWESRSGRSRWGRRR